MSKDIKNIQKNITHPAISFALCGLLLAGCSSNNDSDTPITSPPETAGIARDTQLSIEVVDTNGDPVEGATVTVTSDPDDIIPNTEETLVTEEISDGMVTFAPNEFTGTKAVQVIASKDGFLSNNMPVEVINGEANESSIIITNVTAGATNSAGINAATSSGDNSTNDIITTAKEGDGDDDSKTVVKITADAGATTAEGKPLGKNISVVVAQYDSDEDQSLDAFPGGLAVTITNPADLINSGEESVDGAAPSDGDIIFESAGFTAIEVKDDQGNVAKNFNKPIEISTKIKSDFVNPITGLPVAAGDTIPIWSYEASTGKWSYEKTGTMVEDPNGGLKVDYTVTHLSYYNLDYFYAENCKTIFQFQDANGSPIDAFNGRVRLKRTGGPGGWTHRIRTTSTGESVTFNYVPPRQKMKLKSFTTANGLPLTLVSPTAAFEACAPNATTTHTVVLDAPAIEYSDMTVKASAYCTNDAAAAQVPIPNAWVRIRGADRTNRRTRYYGRTDASGQYNQRLPAGKYKTLIYDFVSRKYSRNTVTLTAGVTGSSLLLVPKTCVTTTGGSTTTQ